MKNLGHAIVCGRNAGMKLMITSVVFRIRSLVDMHFAVSLSLENWQVEAEICHGSWPVVGDFFDTLIRWVIN